MRTHLVMLLVAVAACASSSHAPSHTAATTSAPPVGAWGAPVESPEQEALARAYLTGLAAGRGPEVSGRVIAIGPGLWGQIATAPELAGRGITVGVRLKANGKKLLLAGHAFRNEEMAVVTAAPVFVELGQAFAGGEIRAATAAEREVFYAGISWEIAGTPVTVAHAEGFTLVLFFGEDDDVMLLEVLEPMQALLEGDTSALAPQPAR